MLSQFENAVYKIRYTVEEMQAMTGLGNKVSMQDMSVIEDKVQITHGKKKALKEPIRIGIVVFDLRLTCAVCLSTIAEKMPRPKSTSPCTTVTPTASKTGSRRATSCALPFLTLRHA